MRVLRKTALITTVVVLLASTGVKELVGIASIYHNKFQDRKTANGERFSQNKYTCASNNFPLGSTLLVTNLETGCEVIVIVNDRMALSSQMKGRVVDLSRIAAAELQFTQGLLKVTIKKLNI